MLKHPSSSVCSPAVSMISGLIRMIGSPSITSMTQILLKIPTCGAARPTPLASYIVSNISSINVSMDGVIFCTGLHTLFKHGSPIKRILRIAISFPPGIPLSFLFYLLFYLFIMVIQKAVSLIITLQTPAVKSLRACLKNALVMRQWVKIKLNRYSCKHWMLL